MGRSINKLSARTVDTAKRQGLLADGGGLYLQVGKAGAKSWLFRFTLDRRAREMGIGSLRSVSLASAREKAARCRTLLADGIDPIEARKATKSKQLAVDRKTINFCNAAEAYIVAHEAGWRNDKHASQWRNTLQSYAYPVLGDVLVSDIDTDLVMQVLQPIWLEKSETASRIRGRIERILGWATVSGYRKGQNPAAWRGHLDNLLPALGRVRRVRHHTAMPYQEIGYLITQLRERDGMAPRALEFAILTAARTSEVLGAIWNEFDLKLAIWTVPAGRMKGGREHRVPLSIRALEIIRGMHIIATDNYVFPGANPGRGLSNMALLSLLKRLQVQATTHGFRSSFRDWSAEATDFPREVAEQALSHANASETERAYWRSDLIEKRRQLMETWAAYLDTPNGEVVPLRTRRELA